MAVASLMLIMLGMLMAVFAYWVIPDSSPWANQMSLALSTKKPGFEVQMLRVKKIDAPAQTGVLQMLLYGRELQYKEIPIDNYSVRNDSVCFVEYTGEDFELDETQCLPLSALSDAAGSATDAQAFVASHHVYSRQFLLGTDRYGRDMLSRLLLGTRVSISVGLISVIISLVIGITMGALAGFFRGWVDDVILWLLNVVWSIPTLLLVIAITLALGKGFWQVFIAVGLTTWVEVARVVRGQIFSVRELEYVEAARALGYNNMRIISKHVLPNVLGPVIVIAASNFASAILLEAGLSFLGLGAQPPTPSWGVMIKENYGYIIVDAAYLAVLPGLAIMIMVLAFTFVGSGLRDALDSKQSVSLA